MECDRVTDIRRVGRSEASVQLDEAVGHSRINEDARRLVLPDSNCPKKVLVKTLRSLFRQYNYTVSRYSLNVFHDSMTVRNEELELFSQRHGFLIMPDMGRAEWGGLFYELLIIKYICDMGFFSDYDVLGIGLCTLLRWHDNL